MRNLFIALFDGESTEVFGLVAWMGSFFRFSFLYVFVGICFSLCNVHWVFFYKEKSPRV